jgi:hypothetical protein
MNEKMNKDRETLKAFLSIFAILTAAFFSVAVYQSPIPPEFKPILKGLLVAICVFLLASAVYVYKVSQWCYSSWALSWAMAILFVVCGYKFGLITLMIAFVILWKSKKIMTNT